MEQVNTSSQNTSPASTSSNQPIMKKVVPASSAKNKALMVVAAILIVVAGIALGWKLSGGSVGKSSGPTGGAVAGAIKNNNEAGIDSADCKDTAEGQLEEGGIEGEGTHHLVRSADTTKNVYLGSTVVDLQSFVSKKVQVTGQTISGKKAGWLMDVCKVKVVE